MLEKYLWDAAEYWFYAYKPKSGDVIVDIGAGRGEDVYAFSKAVGPEGRVWAIEPHPESFAVLESLREREGLTNVTTLRHACMDHTASMQIETLPVWESNYIRTGKPSPTSFSVECSPFDEIAAAHQINRIDFLKMNIEGAERFALPGCKEAIRRARNVCIAAHDFRTARGEGESFRTFEFVKEFLADAGFSVITRDDDSRYYVRYHVHGVRLTDQN